MTIIHFKSFKKMEFSHFLYLESRKNGDFFFTTRAFFCCGTLFQIYAAFVSSLFPSPNQRLNTENWWCRAFRFSTTANKQSSSWQSPVPLFCTFVLSSRKRERETKNRRLFYLHTHDHEQLYKTRKCIKSSNAASKPL